MAVTLDRLNEMSVEDRLALRDKMRAMLGKPAPSESPAAFLSHARRGKWWTARHLEYTDAKVMALVNGESAKTMLIITEPPRHGKSEYCSAGLPAWYLGKFPEKRVILCSYEADFAASWGRKARDLLEQFGKDVFGVEVSGKSKAANRWDIAGHSGGMTTAGVGGAITGRGADLLLFDDLIKNAEQAASRGYRDKVWEWLISTALTRLEPGGIVVFIMTRWNEDDPVGRALREQAEQWELLNLPAICEEEGDALGRCVGEALWPERYDAEALAAIKSTVGAYYWSALYQQRPSPMGGLFFKRSMFRYAERLNGAYALHTGEATLLVPLDKCVVFQTIDLAISTDSRADWTCICTWARTPNNDLILLDVWRDRLEGPDQLPMIKRKREQFGAALVGIERTQYQLSMVQAAKRAGLPAVELKADVNKVARALSIAARYEGGCVYHMKGDWLDAYEKELVLFDKGEHDDQVDCAAYAAQFLMQRSGQGTQVTVLG